MVLRHNVKKKEPSVVKVKHLQALSWPTKLNKTYFYGGSFALILLYWNVMAMLIKFLLLLFIFINLILL